MSNVKGKELEAPIFSLSILKDYILVASGGGGAKFGVRNKILSFKIVNNAINDQACHSQEFENEIPVFIHSNENLSIFCSCMNNVTVFFSLDGATGVFKEIYRVKVMDYYDIDFFQSVCTMDTKGDYLAGGTSDGNLK